MLSRLVCLHCMLTVHGRLCMAVVSKVLLSHPNLVLLVDLNSTAGWTSCFLCFNTGTAAPVTLQVFGTKKRMSAVAVLDVAGVDDLFEMVLQLACEGRTAWEARH